MDPAFAEAFVHALARPFRPDDPWSGHKVLGKRLRPFCLWHSFLLEQMGSPFVTGAGVTAADLSRAVAVCRCRYRELYAPTRFCMVAFWKVLGPGLGKEVQRFRDYVGDFQTRPDYHVVPTRGATGPARGQAPDYLRLVAEAIAVARCSRQEAWEMPVGEARWWFAIGLKNRGADLDFADAEQRAAEAREIAALKIRNPALHEALRAAARKIHG